MACKLKELVWQLSRITKGKNRSQKIYAETVSLQVGPRLLCM